MDKKDYINTLKDLNLRPKKVKIKEREESVLLEQDSSKMENVHNKIIKWFMDNPNPNDSQVHKFAESLGIDPDKLEGHIYMILTEILSGGKSKGKPGNHDPKQVKMGIVVEKEHTPNSLVAEKIAWDHLVEIPDYYTRLAKMEKAAGVEEGKILREIFVQSSEIENMPAGPRRDMAILRLAIIAEQDASNLYEKMSAFTKNKDIQKLLLDISNEEKVHVGEFEFLLEHIDPDYEKKENEGRDEAEDLTGLSEPPNEED